ncbi:Polar amino acid ABC transporter, inner membrane subunit OS=Tsukamurella paurometabola (strain ATCC 8368 / DSM / CCUG 35730 / CIP 100753 / JCM 10117 / KCTC 9821 / NBRC 16120 / NCIMB 702349 / NCTC 13040) OX=521096 GN=Tpau_1988 PE=3 SV=1 [Tsukamurella paurometabola]|uniref:Polar amino acid ABC transporter, inner membrane subunit n=1 Tax=Tsukamurella paurometabola (strain ATCC 8368 / DSM 20162 / CCUG 35730 / CIP 100753 / JCM 10117 / KCTC 9821 / NBRC 16120 / NCIMB 702349 / NCTC 13040) TaxID=521096 RepID=D5UNN2_TSUPD|nr:amino acid ABC transporter permease [Tsukamurella paurometabola]ADG78600.1 polar amino acid ABC transporter, inner membrane subunit [Tsukamurella paurometabola DSM 20162]SUP32369.1 Probable amino-acid permease protein yxeN [Tsukamurella paurometabola]
MATTILPPPSPALDAAPTQVRLVGRRRPGRWVTTAAVAVVAAMLVHTLITNERFEWPTVAHYFTQESILEGLGLTLWLTAVTFTAGFVLGIGLAAMRLWGGPLLQSVSFGFVWIVRSVPPLVLLLFWFQLASLYPQLSLGIPFGPEFVTFNTTHLIAPLVAAFIALTLDVAAFAAEIVRGGLVSVDPGQTEAARSLGLNPRRIFRRIVLPQAMPAIIPSSGNLLIGLLKSTSLVSVIAVTDLLYSVQLIYNQNFKVMPLLLVATIWYIVITSVLAIGQYFVERRFQRGRRDARPFREILRDAARLRPHLPAIGARA